MQYMKGLLVAHSALFHQLQNQALHDSRISQRIMRFSWQKLDFCMCEYSLTVIDDLFELITIWVGMPAWRMHSWIGASLAAYQQLIGSLSLMWATINGVCEEWGLEIFVLFETLLICSLELMFKNLWDAFQHHALCRFTARQGLAETRAGRGSQRHLVEEGLRRNRCSDNLPGLFFRLEFFFLLVLYRLWSCKTCDLVVVEGQRLAASLFDSLLGHIDHFIVQAVVDVCREAELLPDRPQHSHLLVGWRAAIRWGLTILVLAFCICRVVPWSNFSEPMLTFVDALLTDVRFVDGLCSRVVDVWSDWGLSDA